MKKTLALLLALIMAFSVFSVAAFAAEPLTGVGFEFVSNFKSEEWTFSHTAGNVTSGGLRLEDGATNKAENVSATYNETLDLTNGFTLTYTMWSNEAKNNWEVGRAYKGAVVGNISAHYELATSTSIKMVIKVNNEVVATSDPVALPDGTVAYNYLRGSSDQTLDYDPATKTITFSMCVVSTQDTYTVSYVDTADAVDVSDASVAIKSNTTWALYAHCSKAKLVGKEPPAPPASFSGTAFDFDSNFVAEDWTFSHTQSAISTEGYIYMQDGGGGKADTVTATYKNKYDLRNGFTINYAAKTNNAKNFETGKPYHGVKIGNIEARIQLVDKSNIMLVIKVAGATAAKSGSIPAAAVSEGTYFYEYIDYELDYDAATKVVTFSMTKGGETNTLTYTDTANAVDVADADVVLTSNCTWALENWYNKAVLTVKTAGGEEPEVPEELFPAPVKAAKATKATKAAKAAKAAKTPNLRVRHLPKLGHPRPL